MITETNPTASSNPDQIGLCETCLRGMRGPKDAPGCPTPNRQMLNEGCRQWKAIKSAVILAPIQKTSLTTGTWDGARKWLQAAKGFEQCKVYCQVKLGFELMVLRKEHGVTHGNNQHEGRTSQNGKSTSPEDWETILRRETGLAQSTAYRYIDMANAAAPRIRKHPALKDFDPTSADTNSLPPAKQAALETVLKKITDVKTQTEFGEQCGLWKKPKGNKAPTGGAKEKLTPEEQARKLREMAIENFNLAKSGLLASNKDFFLLTDAQDTEVEAQVALIEFSLRLRRAWLQTPKAKRDAATIETMLKDSPCN